MIAPLLLATSLLAPANADTDFSIAAMPPSVVSTVPRSGDNAVDPSLSEIRVTFSKDMMTEKMWSCVQISDDSFPKVEGDARYLDDRTFILPVELEPGKPYVVWFNRGKHDAFRDTDNNPAVPYLLVFETRKSTD